MTSMEGNDVTRIEKLARTIRTTDDPTVAEDAARKMRRQIKKHLDRLRSQRAGAPATWVGRR